MYNRFYRHPSLNHNPKSDSILLFDAKDKSTMTRPKDVSSKWSKSTVAVANSSVYGVVTVYDNSFGAKEVLTESAKSVRKMIPKVSGSWDSHSHCEWCGQKLDYVAVIVGLDRNNDATVHHIGCDCVGKIFGIRWYGYRNASNAKKALMDAAKKRRRAVEYPIKYVKELAWLDAVPEFLLVKNSFLVDMKKIMRSGERAVSKKMENYLASIMKRKEYDPKNFATAKQEIDKVLDKLRGILHMVEEVDNEDMRRNSWSAYNFVKSITESYSQWHRALTPKQMEALNRVYVKYRDARLKKTTNQMKGDVNAIPW